MELGSRECKSQMQGPGVSGGSDGALLLQLTGFLSKQGSASHGEDLGSHGDGRHIR